MFGDIIRFLLDITFTLFGAVLVLRCWMQLARVHPRHPVTHSVIQATNWLVLPLRRVVPGVGGIDWASIVAAWLVAIVYLLLLALLSGLNLATFLPAALGLALLTVLKWGLNLVVWMTLIQAVLSWVNPHAPLMPLLQTLTAPLLAPIRRVLPLLGGIDLSPLVLLVIAQVALMMVARLSISLFGFY